MLPWRRSWGSALERGVPEKHRWLKAELGLSLGHMTPSQFPFLFPGQFTLNRTGSTCRWRAWLCQVVASSLSAACRISQQPLWPKTSLVSGSLLQDPRLHCAAGLPLHICAACTPRQHLHCDPLVPGRIPCLGTLSGRVRVKKYLLNQWFKKTEDGTNNWMSRSPCALPTHPKDGLRHSVWKCRKTVEKMTSETTMTVRTVRLGTEAEAAIFTCDREKCKTVVPVGSGTHTIPITSCLAQGWATYHHPFIQNPFSSSKSRCKSSMIMQSLCVFIKNFKEVLYPIQFLQQLGGGR